MRPIGASSHHAKARQTRKCWQSLAEINLSQQAATRLQAFASTYLDHLSQETNKLVRIEVKRSVNDTMTFNKLFDKLHRDWVLRLMTVAAAAFFGALLAHIAWFLFR